MLKTRQLTNEEAFETICKRLKSAADKRRVATWELVDELLSAREILGEKFWQAVEVTQLSQGAVENYMRTGEAWPTDKRFLNMPFDCHTALNTLDPDRRAAAMTMAQKAKWDRDELRRRVAAWKAGDEKAFDYRHKVEASERPARKIIDVPESHAGVEDENGSKEDKPVFDATAAGADMDAELRAENRREFKEARAERSFSTATEKLTYALSLVKAMRNDPEFRSALDASSISASDCELEGHWLVNLAREVRHRQNIEFDNPRKPRAAQAEATADGEADGKRMPRTASPDNPEAKASGDETGTDARGAATPDGLASRASDGAGSVATISQEEKVARANALAAAREMEAKDKSHSHPATSSPPVTSGMAPSPPTVPPTHSDPVATASREAGSTGEGGAVYATASPANHGAAHACDEPDLPKFLDRRGHG